MGLSKKALAQKEKQINAISALESPKLKEAEAILFLSQALGEKLLKLYSYGAIKGKDLVFYFSHPAVLNEFQMQKEQIKERMRVIFVEKKLKGVVIFKEISAKSIPKVPQKQSPSPVISDRASGNFEIACKSIELRRIFANIQHNIQQTNQASGKDV